MKTPAEQIANFARELIDNQRDLTPEENVLLREALWNSTKPAVDVIERVAGLNSSDPATDDLTVPLAIELAEAASSLARLTTERDAAHRALTQAGYTKTDGATDWKPPLGPSVSPLLDTIDDLRAERDAARAAAIEECAQVLDKAAQDWSRIRDPGMASNARHYAKKIRALASTPPLASDDSGSVENIGDGAL